MDPPPPRHVHVPNVMACTRSTSSLSQSIDQCQVCSYHNPELGTIYLKYKVSNLARFAAEGNVICDVGALVCALVSYVSA
jgi:hypothetical protein